MLWFSPDLVPRFQAFDVDGNPVAIEAKNFQSGGATRYSVYESLTAISTRFAVEEGKVKTLRTLDYESDQRTFDLTVRAEDTLSGFSSDVKVRVWFWCIQRYNTCWVKLVKCDSCVMYIYWYKFDFFWKFMITSPNHMSADGGRAIFVFTLVIWMSICCSVILVMKPVIWQYRVVCWHSPTSYLYSWQFTSWTEMSSLPCSVNPPSQSPWMRTFQ